MKTASTDGSSPTESQAVASLGVAAAAAAIRRGEITAETYSTALLESARQHSDLNAFITIDESAVLDAARDAELAPAPQGRPPRSSASPSGSRTATRRAGSARPSA